MVVVVVVVNTLLVSGFVSGGKIGNWVFKGDSNSGNRGVKFVSAFQFGR